MLSVLQTHAQSRGDQCAHVLPDRVITYRRFWSRIERASARLQGEWGVQAGDTVAYAGGGHPDALVLYFALLRLGASLRPFEALSLPALRRALDAADVSRVVHDDAISVDLPHARPLSQMLADWCHVDPVLVAEDPARPALWLPAGATDSRPVSLQALCAEALAQPARVFVGNRIFTKDILTRVILPALQQAERLHFSATETAQRTGS